MSRGQNGSQFGSRNIVAYKLIPHSLKNASGSAAGLAAELAAELISAK